jgi:hypothetical protein
MNFGILACLIVPVSLILIALGLARHSHRPTQGESRTQTGVVMGHVYDPMGFRTLDYVISDEGQNRPEIIVVNNTRDSNLLLIEGADGLTVLELGPESDTHGDTAPLN